MTHTRIILVLVTLTAAACGEDIETRDAEIGAGDRFLTFNTGLARGYLENVDQRRDKLIEALAHAPADVVCLQEVWAPEDAAAIAAGTAATFPHAHFADTTVAEGGGEDAACTEAELGPLAACMFEHCAEAADVASCAVSSCLEELSVLSPGCQQCLVAHLDRPLPEILGTCLQGAGTLLYDGANGVLLLSRRPLRAAGHSVLDSFLVRSVVLHAEIDGGTGPLRVLCTHLASNLPGIQYGGAHGSYEGENLSQVEEVLAILEADPSMPAALMGDLNTGPAVPPAIEADWPDHFARFMEAGLRAPYLETAAPRCTWCGSNRLVEDDTREKIIDHVLIRGRDEATTIARRALDQPIEIRVDGAPRVTHLSDHFGVLVTVLGTR